MNYLREHGPALISNGYKIIPIKRGCKAPLGVKNWTTIEADLNQLGQWASSGFEGVGILCKNNPAVDIDIMDSEVSAIMVQKVTEQFGEQMYARVGKAPKTLLAFRTNKPFKKVRSRTYEDQFGDRHAVEILGDGQQYVAYAEHPDTLRPYKWVGTGLDGLVHGSLPSSEYEGALQIVQAFEQIAEERIKKDGWVKVQEGSRGSVTGTSPSTNPEGDGQSPVLADFSNIRPRLTITDQEVKADLACLSADEYDRWVRVGMALYHQYQGRPEGLNMWNEWSETSAHYSDSHALEIRWRGFAPKGNRRQITFASVRRWARDARMENDPLGEFLDRYVYVADGDLVHDLGDLGHNKAWELREFRNMTENIRVTIDVPAPLAANEDRTVAKEFAVHKLWMKDGERKTAMSFQYVPGGDRVLDDGNGAQFINRFHMPEFPDPCSEYEGDALDTLKEELLGVFFRHMEYLFPVEAERTWIYNWIAFNLQFPGLRCKVTPLMIATDHGTGRGWLAQLMAKLLGSWNCTKTKMSTLNGDSSAGAYQDFMNDSLLCCIEEVRDADKPYGVESKIRDYLTEDTLEINIKYGAKMTKRVYTNFTFHSNATDAMVLKSEDRRINVFLTTNPPKGGDYYDRLYQWLEHPDHKNRAETLYQRGPNALPPAVSSGCGGDPSDGDNDDYSDAIRRIQGDLEKDEKFFDRAGVKAGPGVACLWHWLMARDLAGFNSHRSFHNKARADLIKNSQTDVEELFLDMCKEPPFPVMTMTEIQEHIENEKRRSGDPGSDFGILSDSEKRQMKKLIQHNMVRYDQIRVTKKVYFDEKSGAEISDKLEADLKFRPWGFKGSKELSTAEIREIYEKRF